MKKYNKLVKIISGGQTGVDIAGLEFAKEIGLETGGSAPNDFVTEKGKNFDLEKIYGLKDSGKGYAERTKMNVNDSDGTLLFIEKTSPGSVLTLNACKKLRKPCLVSFDTEKIVKFLNENNIKIVNIAGNRESVSPGICERVKKKLRSVITNE